MQHLASWYYKRHRIILDALKTIPHILRETIHSPQIPSEIFYDDHNTATAIRQLFAQLDEEEPEDQLIKEFPLIDLEPADFLHSLTGHIV